MRYDILGPENVAGAGSGSEACNSIEWGFASLLFNSTFFGGSAVSYDYKPLQDVIDTVTAFLPLRRQARPEDYSQ